MNRARGVVYFLSLWLILIPRVGEGGRYGIGPIKLSSFLSILIGCSNFRPIIMWALTKNEYKFTLNFFIGSVPGQAIRRRTRMWETAQSQAGSIQPTNKVGQFWKVKIFFVKLEIWGDLVSSNCSSRDEFPNFETLIKTTISEVVKTSFAVFPIYAVKIYQPI